MEIPLDSSIAHSTTLQREQNKAEQEQLKRLVLDYESREEAADKAGMSELMTFVSLESYVLIRLSSPYSSQRIARSSWYRPQLRSRQSSKRCQGSSCSLILSKVQHLYSFFSDDGYHHRIGEVSPLQQ